MDQTVHVFRALGLFDLAWPLLALLAVPRFARRIDRGWIALATLTALSCLSFAVLEFGGFGTVTVHGSYSIVVGLFACAAVLLYRLSRRAARWVFGANALATFLVWVVLAPGAVLEPLRRLQPLPLVTAVAALGLLLALSGRGAADDVER